LITGPAAIRNLRFRAMHGNSAPARPAGYRLVVKSSGAEISYRDEEGLRAAIALFANSSAEFGRRLPCVVIDDYSPTSPAAA